MRIFNAYFYHYFLIYLRHQGAKGDILECVLTPSTRLLLSLFEQLLRGNTLNKKGKNGKQEAKNHEYKSDRL